MLELMANEAYRRAETSLMPDRQPATRKVTSETRPSWIPAMPDWHNYDLMAAAVTAADE